MVLMLHVVLSHKVASQLSDSMWPWEFFFLFSHQVVAQVVSETLENLLFMDVLW